MASQVVSLSNLRTNIVTPLCVYIFKDLFEMRDLHGLLNIRDSLFMAQSHVGICIPCYFKLCKRESIMELFHYTLLNIQMYQVVH